MRRISAAATAGFTLIELLVVIGILSLLMVVLLPRILESQEEAEIFADRANLSWHYQNIQSFRNRKHKLPKGGGHKFVLAPWVMGVCEHTEENRDRYFTPDKQTEDERWLELTEEDPKDIWQSYDDLIPEDTHYAGRSAKHYKTMKSGNEALMANVLTNGSINVLMGSGTVKTLYRHEQLAEYWDEDDEGFYIDVGPDSPVPVLQKLSR